MARRIVKTEAYGGAVLLLASIVALVWANVSDSYASVWDDGTRHIVNDWMMAVFFFVAGLEIKREVVSGELRDRRVAALPIVAALGGMAVPPLLFAAINAGSATAAGWAIPMATDIAFAVGALSLVGSRAAVGLRVFVLTLAVADDIGAIAVMAIFYAGGVHPTVIAVGLALLVTTKRSVLATLQRWLEPVSAYVVVPVFALANAGVVIRSGTLDAAIASRLFWGIVVGLVVGKTIGVYGAVRISERFGLGRRPAGVADRDVLGGAVLAGIGFTVSLFIAELAFSGSDLAVAKLAIVAASILGASIGYLLLRTQRI